MSVLSTFPRRYSAEQLAKGSGTTRVDVAATKAAADDKAWREVCLFVDLRDGRTCRNCGRRSNPNATGLLERGHRHHIVYRSAVGADVSANLVTLCAYCHNEEHVKRTLRVEGNADVALTFLRPRPDHADDWYVWRQEISVGVFEKD